MIYGALGFTGRLVAEAARRRGLPTILAARSDAVLALADTLGAEGRCFDAASPGPSLAGVTVLLSSIGGADGPSRALAEACAATGIHYLDLAGEYPAHRALEALDAQARATGAMLLPGVGFGVVPTDIAAARAARGMDRVDRLILAYETRGAPSRGTLQTVLPDLHKPGVRRLDGTWRPDLGGRRSHVETIRGRRVRMVSNPWRADQVSAVRSTGAATVETFSNFPLAARLLMRIGGTGLGRMLVRQAISGAEAGPGAEVRKQGGTTVWACAEGSGRSTAVRIDGPEAYDFTAETAALCAERALSGAMAGLQTPSSAFGPDLLQAMAGVTIHDLGETDDHR